MIGASAKPTEGQLALTMMPSASAGDKYKVTLRIAGKWRTVDWECIETSKPTEPKDDGVYYVAANWSAWTCDTEFTNTTKTAGEYTAEVVLQSSVGKFQIVRNQDWSQTFFPVGNVVMGPGTASGQACWTIEGQAGDVYQISLKRVWKTTAFETTVSWTKTGTKPVSELDDIPWPRYYFTSVQSGAAEKHEMEPISANSYGFTLQLTHGPVPFQILFDGDSRKTYYPNVAYASTDTPKVSILGPGVPPKNRSCWRITRDLDDKGEGEDGGWYTVEVTVSAVDRTPKRVSWMRVA